MESIDRNTVLIFKNDGMGTSDKDLQHKLAKTYLTMLLDNGYLPAAICFYTDGVHLVCEGSPVLDELSRLAALGVPLIICKTCLDYLNLAKKTRIGVVGGMADIIEAQWRSARVITL